MSEPNRIRSSLASRIGWFVVICIVGLVAIAGYVAVSRTGPANKPGASPARSPWKLAGRVPPAPFVMFRNLSEGDAYGKVALAPLSSAPGERLVSTLSCERLHFAGGLGVCMVGEPAGLQDQYVAYVFDGAFERRHRILLTGIPTRARVSPDGRRAAVTVFEQGHSYAEEGFSTRSTLIETASGRVIGDLEDFSVSKDGRPFKAIDFNFWGITFDRDGNRFFATLASGGENYLVEGSVDDRRAVVQRSGVECPSLSPDATRVAYKKRLADRSGWRLWVLDLARAAEHELNQGARSVDDQVDWFDNDHIVYHDASPEGTGVWILDADGSGSPRLLLADAYSPAVQR